MSENNDGIESGRTVGDRVQMKRAGVEQEAGTIVEDFAESLCSGDALGRTWARPKRWAIALDSGTLVFADDSELA
ncbi:hypothetical protein [Rhodococcoides kyotonense]|uniref:Uncharacterized protein n=1 Tax=Rhodococcoides kyotonense TaxID=398843 RepID=A0A177YE35_9NOCA|nr:hypothetical protein [Rhodococcus kyotonensis]OAK53777.1 hypothetical protein A3K89_21875 [Rhodococcus kyotonensis]